MNLRFEQPKHLTNEEYRRAVCALRPLIIVFGFIMSGMMLFALWQKEKAGLLIPKLNWFMAATACCWIPVIFFFAIRCQSARRSYLEFRAVGIFLSGRGLIVSHRFLSWSFVPDKLDPKWIRLKFEYKFGIFPQRWSMLLDDSAVITELRNMLTLQISRAEKV